MRNLLKNFLLLTLISNFASSAAAQELTDPSQLTKAASHPRILKFYADWCGPCRLIKPILKRIERRYQNKVEVVEIDIGNPKNRQLMKDYGISQIPSLVFQSGGGEQFTTVGALSEDDVRADVREILKDYEHNHP